jgi:hypothetical protein
MEKPSKELITYSTVNNNNNIQRGEDGNDGKLFKWEIIVIDTTKY